MYSLCLGIAENYLCALGLVIAKIYMHGLCVVINKNFMCALSLTLKFLCTRYVSLSLKNILHALCVVSQSYVRALCLGIDKNYLCALGLVFAKIYMCTGHVSLLMKIVCACFLSLIFICAGYVSLLLKLICTGFVIITN